MHHGKRKRSRSGENLEVDSFCDLSALKLYYSAVLKELIGQEDSCSHKVNNLSGRVGNEDIIKTENVHNCQMIGIKKHQSLLILQ